MLKYFKSLREKKNKVFLLPKRVYELNKQKRLFILSLNLF